MAGASLDQAKPNVPETSRPLEQGLTHTHTLMEMRTDLTAAPHAGLGYHFLRAQVDQTNSIDDHATG